MAIPVIMPRQGQSVESCILTNFFKKAGENVNKGEPLFAYETDKASFEEAAPETGTLLAVFYEQGDEIPVLSNVCVIGVAGESFAELAPANGIMKEPVQAAKEAKPELKPTAELAAKMEASMVLPTVNEGKVFISPRARVKAESAGVDIRTVAGTGPNGRIIASDIEKYLASAPKVTPLARKVACEEGLQMPDMGTGIGGAVTAKDLVSKNPVYAKDSEIVSLSNIRKIIAKAMHQSLQNSAQLTHHLGADARKLLEMRKKAKVAKEKGYAYDLTLNDFICYAVVRTLMKYPKVNAHFMGDSTRQFNKVHLGLAVDTDRGLMVPAIKNADDLSVQGLSSQMKQIAANCKAGSIDPDLLASDAASFTVSNLGNYGVEMFTPVINLPQVAILGVNTIVPRPKDLGDGVYGFVPYLGLSLTYDHRAIDGGEATRFLKDIAIEIENFNIDI